MSEKVMTPEFRVSFPHVFKAQKPMNEGAEPKYGISMLFPKGADLSKLKAIAKEAIQEKWGDKPPKNLRSPFRDQGEKEYSGYEEGAIFVNATSKMKPGIVDRNREDIISEEDFYAGCYARATIRAFAYDVSGNRGVGFGLQNLQKLRDGEPLGGRTSPQSDFEDVAGGDDGEVDDASDLF